MGGGAAPGAVDDYGLPADFQVGTGYGYIPYYEDEQKIRDAMLLGKAGVGESLLKDLTSLAQDPTAGPLGLAVLGGYGGGAQNVAAGTGGKGISNPYIDRLTGLEGSLQDWVQSPGSPFAPGSGGLFDQTKAASLVDPNKAPAMTPDAAAKAPDATGEFFKQWSSGAYDAPGVKDRLRAIAGTNLPEGKSPEVPATPGPFSGFKDGGKTLIGDLHTFISGAAHPDDWVDRIRKANKVTTAIRDLVPSEAVPPADASAPPVGAMNGGNIATGGYEDGGGMTLRDKPHFIVDHEGNPVAALTEDGKPERVEGFGGVEVTPLTPERRAAYEASKRMSKVASEATSAIPGAASGSNLLFPDIPGSQVNQSPGTPEGGSTEIPTWGGTSESWGDLTKGMWKPGIDAATGAPNTMPEGATANERYAKLLGSSLSQDTAIDPTFLRGLGAGRVTGLPSMESWRTMLPSQQTGMLALMQQMGLGSKADIMQQMKDFRPTGLK